MASRKNLSCKPCQTRKIKCDRSQPCSNCTHALISCEYRIVDVRRRPVSQTHLSTLNSRLAWYESVLQTLKDSTSADRDALLEDITFDNGQNEAAAIPSVRNNEETPIASETPRRHATTLLPGPSGTLQFHGPTSMYLNDERHNTLPPSYQLSGPTLEPWSSIRFGSALGIDDSLIRTCLRLFFTREYCRCMFIYREAFLEDYFNNGYNGRYWSYPLLYAICALGANCSDDPIERSKATMLAKCAQDIIFTHCLSSPNITTVQALLCVAFHELGQGSSSLGWLYSGMAFRMGQELGFQQDPQIWLKDDQNSVTKIDVEIRRRVYWGCYIADKYISLFLGRPVLLADVDAAVVMSEPLPDFPEDDDWFGLGNIASGEAHHRLVEQPRLTLALKFAVPLGRILQDAMTYLFAPKSTHKSDTAIISALGQLNLRLSRWLADLPLQLQWSQWSKNGQELKRSVLELHFFYHSVLLCLNRHFLRHGHCLPYHQASEQICASSCNEVIALLRHSRIHYDSKHVSLMMIYATVLTAIISSGDSSESRVATRKDPSVVFCIRVLHAASDVYRLAADAHSRLTARLDVNVGNQNDAEDEGHDKSSLNSASQWPIGLPTPDSTEQAHPSLAVDKTLDWPLEDAYTDTSNFLVDLPSSTGSYDSNLVFDSSMIPVSDPNASESEHMSMGQNNLDLFSMLMDSDPTEEMRGSFSGWFSDVLV